MTAGRRKREDENIRSLIRMSNGKSYYAEREAK